MENSTLQVCVAYYKQGEKPKTKNINGVEYIDPSWLVNNFNRGLRNIAIDIGRQIYMFNSVTEEEIKN